MKRDALDDALECVFVITPVADLECVITRVPARNVKRLLLDGLTLPQSLLNGGDDERFSNAESIFTNDRSDTNELAAPAGAASVWPFPSIDSLRRPQSTPTAESRSKGERLRDHDAWAWHGAEEVLRWPLMAFVEGRSWNGIGDEFVATYGGAMLTFNNLKARLLSESGVD